MSSFNAHLLSLVAFIMSAAGVAGSEPGQAPKASSESAKVQTADMKDDSLPPGAIVRLGALRLQHVGNISNLLFTRDGTGLISAGSEPVVRLWDPSTGKEVRRFVGHQAPVYSIALSPDSKMLASGGEDQTIRLWDVATGRELKHWSVADDARGGGIFSHR
jgi:WD40 repeat protein